MACLLALPAHAGAVLDREQLAGAVAALMAERGVSDATPGCAVGVIERGEWALRAGFGLANLEHGVPLSAQSVFRIGSVSKQVTATAIALLAEAGKIDLDADVHRYLPDLARYDHPVTVRQMIHHVSGIPDYEQGLPALKTADGQDLELDNRDYLSIREFYDRVRTIPLFAPPQTAFAYSNTAYFLLSQIVEAASGQSLRSYAQQHIFAPLGMSQSFFNDSVNAVVPQRADGYRRNAGGGFDIYMTNLSWVGDGGVYTSLDDWLKWDQHFYSNPLGQRGAALIRQMEQTHPRSGTYAWGQDVGRYRGYRQIDHTGAWVGFTSYYARYPKLRTALVIFCNSDLVTAGDLMELRDLILAPRAESALPSSGGEPGHNQ